MTDNAIEVALRAKAEELKANAPYTSDAQSKYDSVRFVASLFGIEIEEFNADLKRA